MMAVRARPQLTAVDLFSGCGGLTSGLQSAGLRVIAAVENDLDSALSYRFNHPLVKLYQTDIRGLSPSALLRDCGLRRGDLTILAGCPPCQGFTRLTEKNARRDARNGLVLDYLRFARELLPKMCFF